MALNLINQPQLTPAEQVLLLMQKTDEEVILFVAIKAREAFNSFWRNPSATPFEIAERLGTNAANVFSRHAATVKFLLSQNPGILAPEDYTPPIPYRLETDGSLTFL
jgi:hypothetical protein